MKKKKAIPRGPPEGSLLSITEVGLLGLFISFDLFVGGSILGSLEKASANTFFGPGM